MAKEIQKSLCTIESRAGAIAIVHIQLLSRIGCFAQFQPGHIYGLYTVYGIYTRHILWKYTDGGNPSTKNWCHSIGACGDGPYYCEFPFSLSFLCWITKFTVIRYPSIKSSAEAQCFLQGTVYRISRFWCTFVKLRSLKGISNGLKPLILQ
jgi:hypothetical protein